MERQNERSLRNCLRKYKEKELRREETKGSKRNFRTFRKKFNSERWGLGKIRSFWEQQMCRIEERKNNDGLVYAVVEQGDPKSRVRVLHRSHLLSREEFPAFTEGESNKKQQ